MLHPPFAVLRQVRTDPKTGGLLFRHATALPEASYRALEKNQFTVRVVGMGLLILTEALLFPLLLAVGPSVWIMPIMLPSVAGIFLFLRSFFHSKYAPLKQIAFSEVPSAESDLPNEHRL